MNITLIVNNTEKHNHIWKLPNCFKVKVGQSSCLITTGNILWLSHYSITAFSGCFQYQIKLLILRSCEMGKLHVLKLSYRFEQLLRTLILDYRFHKIFLREWHLIRYSNISLSLSSSSNFRQLHYIKNLESSWCQLCCHWQDLRLLKSNITVTS